jgi:hypothetical protein
MDIIQAETLFREEIIRPDESVRLEETVIQNMVDQL